MSAVGGGQRGSAWVCGLIRVTERWATEGEVGKRREHG